MPPFGNQKISLILHLFIEVFHLKLFIDASSRIYNSKKNRTKKYLINTNRLSTIYPLYLWT